MRSFTRDIRYALRSLRNTPQFTLIAVLTLALGIGANTAIFSLLDHLQFRNIAVHEPHRLVRLEVPGRFADTFFGGPFCVDHPMLLAAACAGAIPAAIAARVHPMSALRNE